VLFVGLVGCGRIGFDEDDTQTAPVVPPPASYQDGTRLRAMINDVGGAKQFLSWFDTQFGQECTRAVAEDGVTRCLPVQLTVAGQFSDPACTVPVGVGRTASDSAACPYAATVARMPIGDQTRVVQVGALYSGALYQVSGTCSPTSPFGFTYYSVGATVAPDMFVAFHDELTASGDLAYIEYVGDDGARELDATELVVRASGEHCRLMSISHDEWICAPKQPMGTPAFADAACTEPAVVIDQPPTPHVHQYVRLDTCEDDILDLTLGQELTTGYELDASQACVAQNRPAPYRTFRVTAVAPTVRFATAQLDVPAGSPVVVPSWRFTQGQSLPTDFYDTRYGDFCSVTTVADTRVRVCAPVWTGFPPVYQDASCTVAINGFPRCRGAWRSEWFPVAPAQWTCEGVAEYVYRYDQPIAGPYYETVNNACALADPIAVEPSGRSATVMPTGEMAPVTRRMD